MRRILTTILLLTFCSALGATQTGSAQQPAAVPSSQPTRSIDRYTPASLLEEAKPLAARAAAGKGAAAETLQKYGVDYTMLSVRDRDGKGELHEHDADIFVILDGTATLLTGGELRDPTSLSPGELTGTAVLNGTTTQLAKGDIVHIPANTPHQLLIPKGSRLTYFVIKVRERE
jgi:mannose-6-phosphate isomerase-like protein (cupin superfamily)